MCVYIYIYIMYIFADTDRSINTLSLSVLVTSHSYALDSSQQNVAQQSSGHEALLLPPPMSSRATPGDRLQKLMQKVRARRKRGQRPFKLFLLWSAPTRESLMSRLRGGSRKSRAGGSPGGRGSRVKALRGALADRSMLSARAGVSHLSRF